MGIRCETCDYCQWPRSSNDNWGACKCKAMQRKTIDVSVCGGQVPTWCPLKKEKASSVGSFEKLENENRAINGEK